MKTIFMTILWVLSINTFARDGVIELLEVVNFGLINQTNTQVGESTFLVRRTSNTGRKVKVHFQVLVEKSLCDIRNKKSSFIPSTCYSWSYKPIPESKYLIFDFKDAAVLGKGDFEYFEISFNQIDFKSSKVFYEAKVIKSDFIYEIVKRNRWYRRAGLDFSAY